MELTLTLETLRTSDGYCPTDVVLGHVRLRLAQDTLIHEIEAKLEVFGEVPISKRKLNYLSTLSGSFEGRVCRKLLKIRLPLLQSKQPPCGKKSRKYKLARGEHSFPFVLDFSSIQDDFCASNAQLGLQTLPLSQPMKIGRSQPPLKARYILTASLISQSQLGLRVRVSKVLGLKVIDREIEQLSAAFDSISYAIPLLCMSNTIWQDDSPKEQLNRSLCGALPVYSPSLSLCAAVRQHSISERRMRFPLLVGILLPFSMKPLPLIKLLSFSVIASMGGEPGCTASLPPLGVHQGQLDDCHAELTEKDQLLLTFSDPLLEAVSISEGAWKSLHHSMANLSFQVTCKISVVDAQKTQIATVKVAYPTFTDDEPKSLMQPPLYTHELTEGMDD